MSVTDWTPATSDSLYVSISYDSGVTWELLSDTLAWGNSRPSTRVFTYTPDTILNNVLFGLFVNPYNIWSSTPIDIFNANIVSKTATFSFIPDTIFNGGKYMLEIELEKEKFPDIIQLQYSFDNTTWYNLDSLEITGDLFDYSFVNNYTGGDVIYGLLCIYKDVMFRLVYPETDIPIASTPFIPYKDRDTYFKFNITSGYSEIYDDVDIVWEKSYNFANLDVEIYWNDSLILSKKFYTNKVNLKFQNYGNYVVKGIADDVNFRIVEEVVFTVKDPCENLSQSYDSLQVYTANIETLIDSLQVVISDIQNELDSVVILNNTLEERNKELVLLEENLRKWIEDSTLVQLVYKDGDITSVEDSKYTVEIRTDLDIQDGSIILNKENLTWWIFDYTAKLVRSENSVYVDAVNIGDLPSGVYYFYTLEDMKYTLYKFTK